MPKISFPKFKTHIGLLSDVGGVLGLLGTIKAFFFSDSATLWAFTLQLNWIVGMMAFCVLLGWLVVVGYFLDSVRSVSDWMQRKNLGETLGIKTVAPDINWSGFIIAGAVMLAFWVSISSAMLLAAKWKPDRETKQREELGNDIFWLLYLVVTTIAGIYFALTVKPDEVSSITSLGWLIRPLGWVVLPLLAVLMGILLVKVWMLLVSRVFTTEETDKRSAGGDKR
jgi:hypothetical protein